MGQSCGVTDSARAERPPERKESGKVVVDKAADNAKAAASSLPLPPTAAGAAIKNPAPPAKTCDSSLAGADRAAGSGPSDGTQARTAKEPQQLTQLRKELQTQEDLLHSLHRCAGEHMALIETLEQETFLKEEKIQKLRESEAAYKEAASLRAELHAKDEEINQLMLKSAKTEHAIKLIAGESKGKGDLLESIVCKLSEPIETEFAPSTPPSQTGRLREGSAIKLAPPLEELSRNTELQVC